MKFNRATVTVALCGVFFVAQGCGARASGGGPGNTNTTSGSDAGNVQNGVDTGLISTGPDCATSCALLVQCFGSVVGTMGECVSQCRAMGAPAECHQCVQAQCTSCGAACQQCFASSVCQGTSMNPGDGGPMTPRDSGMVTPTDPCASAMSCDDCTQRADCGWCNGRCYQGTETGPTGASCGATSWAWVSGQCSTNTHADAGASAVSSQCQECVVSQPCGAAGEACLSDSVCMHCLENFNDRACGENKNFIGLAQCACTSCTGSCGVECQSLMQRP